MRVGHTRCMIDGNFGLIKKVCRHSDVDTVAQLSDIVSRSSLTNVPQLYPWEWRVGYYACQTFRSPEGNPEISTLFSLKRWVVGDSEGRMQWRRKNTPLTSTGHHCS